MDDKAQTNRTQPFRKAPPPPPQCTNQDEDEDDVKVISRPTVARRQYISDNNINKNNVNNNSIVKSKPRPNGVSKPSKELNNLKAATTSPNVTIPTTTIISANSKNLNRRSKVLSKPSIKPPPPPKPKI